MNQHGIIYPSKFASYRGDSESFGRSFEPDFDTIPEFQSAVEPTNLQQAAVVNNADVVPQILAITSAPSIDPAAEASGRTEDEGANLLQTARQNGDNPQQSNNSTNDVLLYAGIAGAAVLILILVWAFKKKK